MIERLIAKIKSFYINEDKYDQYGLKDEVSNYCRTYHISKDTSRWIYLVSSLWCELEEIPKNFDSIEDFENWLSYEVY